MKLIGYELYRIVTDRRSILGITAMLFVVLLTGVSGVLTQDVNPFFSEERAIIGELSTQPLEDVQTTIEMYMSENDPILIGEFTREYQIYEIVQEEVTQISDYQDTISDILKKTKTQSHISIFASAYSTADAEKTAAIYEKIINGNTKNNLKLDLYEGVRRFDGGTFLNVVFLAVQFLGVMLLFLQDETGETDLLERTQFYGRMPHMAAKVVVLVIYTIISGVMFGGMLYLTYGILYGFGDVSRALQSVLGFSLCPYTICVGEYFARIILLKICGAIAFVLVWAVIGIMTRKTGATFAIASGVTASSYVMTTYIPESSFFVGLKYMNPYKLVEGSTIFKGYRNLNIFGTPLNAFSCGLFVCVLITVVSGFVLVFAGRRLKSGTRWRFSTPSLPEGRTIFSNELYKIMVCEKGWVIPVACIAAAIVFYSGTHESLPKDEAYYRSYMRAWTGTITEEVENEIQAEALRYQKAHEILNQLAIRNAAGEISEAEYTASSGAVMNTIQRESAFMRAQDRIDQIIARGENQIVYETGFLSLFRFWSVQHILTILLTLSLIIGLYIQEQKCEETYGMKRLLNAAYRGRKERKNAILFIVTVNVILINLLLFFFEIRSVNRIYGLSGFGCSAACLADRWSEIRISIGWCVALYYAFRMVLHAAISWLIGIVIVK